MQTILKGRTKTVKITTDGPFTLIGEKINPTGRKKLAAVLQEGNLDYVRELARKQIEGKADVLDVNVGVPGIDDVSLLPKVVEMLVSEFGIPLCIDTPNPIALAARVVDAGSPNMRRLVSEAKKFTTDAAWEVANIAMQVMGGIGYTDVFPIEKAVRDIRLTQIWTGTNEIMNLLIQHEYYREVLDELADRRNIEADAMHADDVEKVYADKDQEKGMSESSE